MAIKEENVLNFNLRRKSNTKKQKVKNPTSPAEVLDLSDRREEILAQERRRVKRTILNQFIGVHILVPKHGLLRVQLIDVSADGLSFDVPANMGRFRSGEQLVVRIYLNQKTYFAFVVEVRHVRTDKTEKVHRHGASLKKGSINDQALNHFIGFIESVSASLQTDDGDVVVSHLGQTKL